MDLAMLGAFIRSPFFKWAMSLTTLVGIVAYIFHAGEMHKQIEWDAEKAQLQKVIVELKGKQNDTTVKTVIQYVDRIKYVTVNSGAVSSAIDEHITPDLDKNCVIPTNFVVLLNDAATNTNPNKKDTK